MAIDAVACLRSKVEIVSLQPIAYVLLLCKQVVAINLGNVSCTYRVATRFIAAARVSSFFLSSFFNHFTGE